MTTIERLVSSNPGHILDFQLMPDRKSIRVQGTLDGKLVAELFLDKQAAERLVAVVQALIPAIKADEPRLPTPARPQSGA
jgi:hypothetical protein